MAKKGKSGNTRARRVGYELIKRDHVEGHPIYSLLDEIVHEHHEDLREARIVLAWNLTWQADADGRVKLAACARASDLARELAPFDFVILLRKSTWKDERFTDEHRRALMDHALCHGARAYDKSENAAVDERGRPVWRTRKPDIVEFSEVIERHGIYSRDLERIADALRKQGVGPFVHCDHCALTPGWIDVLVGGVTRKDRCECWKAWTERRQEYKADQRASA
jgi:hypothetical protein